MKPVNYPLSSMIKADLLSVAESLPEVDEKDHKFNILNNYEVGGWSFVDAYVDSILLMASLQPRRDTVIQKIGKYLDRGVEWFTGLKIWEIR